MAENLGKIVLYNEKLNMIKKEMKKLHSQKCLKASIKEIKPQQISTATVQDNMAKEAAIILTNMKNEKQ